MRYIRTFTFSDQQIPRTNLYPYNILQQKAGQTLSFDTITMIAGANGSGKSSFLNLLAVKLRLNGAEPPKSFDLRHDPFQEYLQDCHISFDSDDAGFERKLPEHHRYLKSEDILYEIKKIQQERILQEGHLYERRRLGMTREQAAVYRNSWKMKQQIDRQQFAQEKYSNGETALQVFEDYLEPDGLYLLDEPEVSLAPEKQLELGAMINESARFLNTQFIIATHSPLLLGSLMGTIYNFDDHELKPADWHELSIVQLYRDFLLK